MKKHQKECRQFLAEIGPEAFKRPLFTHRNAINTGWKRVGRVSRDNTISRESILEQTNASKHERTRGARTDEENRRNEEVLKQGTEALEVIYGNTAKIQ